MRSGFFSRLALDGIRRNRQLYRPYLMTCALMAAVYYILHFLSRDPVVLASRGGSSMGMVLLLGRFVIIVFSVIFLFYTNSFLIRRRKKEFGLYNVLGMNKRNIARILLWETLCSYGISMGAGLGSGVALSKLAQLFLLRLTYLEIDYGFRVDPQIVLSTLLFFAAIFLLIFLNCLRQLHFSNPIELVRSENTGERPPKARWLLGFGGFALMAVAYYLAVSIRQPLEALVWFFVAVLMVIVATYLLFITGSVVFCRLLQRNKSFYYRPRNFVSVSSMVYRMKRNGAGLASICILLTMVLVMISSSACLYFGKDGALKARYPRDICAQATVYGYTEANREICSTLQDIVESEISTELMEPESLRIYNEYCIVGLIEGNGVEFTIDSTTNQAFIDYSKVATVHLVSLADYNAMRGSSVTLQPREVLLSAFGGEKLPEAGECFTLGELEFTVHQRIDEQTVDFDKNAGNSVSSTIVLVLNEREETAEYLSRFKDYDGEDMLYLNWLYQFNSPATPERLEEIVYTLAVKMENYLLTRDEPFHSYCDSAKVRHDDFYGTFGSLFFIGILLSLVFLVACVLMMYYKQLSEGYEDQSRFTIMRKVGMTKEDIRRSIDAQMLMVFLLPIGFAVVHLCFAFPMVEKVLMIFGVMNRRLFLLTNLIGVGTILVFYTAVYRLTGNAYFRIVSGCEEKA